MDTEDKRNIGKEILSTLVYMAALVFLILLANHYIVQRIQVDGGSMYPNLENGDNLIADKISYRFREPRRYDIIVFPYRMEERTYFIKRIIGLPGETVQVTGGKIYIDGEVLQEEYGREEALNGGTAEEPVTLGEDEYFVMGDNRNNSKDSRDSQVGMIHRNDIVGRAFARIWPLNKFGILKHQ